MSAFIVHGPSSFAVRGRSYESEAPERITQQARRHRRWPVPVRAVVLLLLALAAWQLGGAAW